MRGPPESRFRNIASSSRGQPRALGGPPAGWSRRWALGRMGVHGGTSYGMGSPNTCDIISGGRFYEINAYNIIFTI